VLGIIIFAIRGIKLDPAGQQQAPPPAAPHSFILRMGLNSWACTMSGTVMNCTYRTPARMP
jgi:hypothetical protein